MYKRKRNNNPLAMRYTQSEKISSSIERSFKAMGLWGKYKEAMIINSWAEMMGKSISDETEYIYIKERVLYIKIRSSILRSELSMLGKGIISSLNKKAGESIVDSVVIR